MLLQAPGPRKKSHLLPRKKLHLLRPFPLPALQSSSSEGVVSQGTISAWELAVEQHAAGSSSSEAITLNGKTLTEAEWESEAQTFHEEDFRCQFLEFSGLTEEAYVALRIQADERNLEKRKQEEEVKRGKKRKQEAEAQKKVRD